MAQSDSGIADAPEAGVAGEGSIAADDTALGLASLLVMGIYVSGARQAGMLRKRRSRQVTRWHSWVCRNNSALLVLGHIQLLSVFSWKASV